MCFVALIIKFIRVQTKFAVYKLLNNAFQNIKDLLIQIKSSVENYDCDEELGGVVMSARKVNTNSDLHLQTNKQMISPLVI